MAFLLFLLPQPIVVVSSIINKCYTGLFCERRYYVGRGRQPTTDSPFF